MRGTFFVKRFCPEARKIVQHLTFSTETTSRMSSEQIAVIPLSYKDRYLDRNPSSPKRRIKVVLAAKAEEAVQSRQHTQDVFGKRYKRVLQSGEDGPQFFDGYHEAYRHALNRIEHVRAWGGDIAFDDPDGHQVYIIELSASVREFKKMVKSNGPELINTADTFCSMGQTSKAAEDRYIQHRDPDDRKSSEWGLEYFKAPFEAAYRSDLIDEFKVTSGQSVHDLRKSEAHIVEADVALWLRSIGIAAYFK